MQQESSIISKGRSNTIGQIQSRIEVNTVVSIIKLYTAFLLTNVTNHVIFVQKNSVALQKGSLFIPHFPVYVVRFSVTPLDIELRHVIDPWTE